MSDETVTAYLDHLISRNRPGTARSVGPILRQYVAILASRGRTPLTASRADCAAYRTFLAGPQAALSGGSLSLPTQGTRIAAIKGFHRFLLRRGLVLHDAAVFLELPADVRRRVRADGLDQQEAQALLETAAAQVAAANVGTRSWALHLRNLALVGLALATGRRRAGLLGLNLDDLDEDRDEIRVAWEKGRPGRVLPVAAWAMGLVGAYRDRAREVLAAGRTSSALFLGERSERLGPTAMAKVLTALHAATCAANPDLTALPRKGLSSHSLRVTFACTLFANGCPIRSVNELLLHRKLATTARYTPIPLEELARVLRAAHPRG